jgi:hypothetical protein
MENYRKAGISSMFETLTFTVFSVKGKNLKKKKIVLANKTQTFTYEALLSYYSIMDRLQYQIARVLPVYNS